MPWNKRWKVVQQCKWNIRETPYLLSKLDDNILCIFWHLLLLDTTQKKPKAGGKNSQTKTWVDIKQRLEKKDDIEWKGETSKVAQESCQTKGWRRNMSQEMDGQVYLKV